MNEIMKIFNYGQKDYEIVALITNQHCSNTHHGNEGSLRQMNKNITPYQIVMNKHKELLEMLETYAEHFPRFIKSFKRVVKSPSCTCFENDNNDIVEVYRGYAFTVNGYIMSKAFLSYIVQNKDSIIDMFNYEICTQHKEFTLPNIFKVLRFRIGSDGLTKMCNGHYDNIKLFNEITQKNEVYNLDMNSDYTIINDKRYHIHRFKCLKDGWLSIDKYQTLNNYDIFRELLSEYFASVNTCNDDDFDTYLGGEAQKLMRMDFDKELERLQNDSKSNK